MRLSLVTPPASEPVTLAEAKSQLRLTSSFTVDDTYITGLITEAREYCEARSHVCFLNQTWDIFLDAWTPFAPSNATAYFQGYNQTGTTIYTESGRQHCIVLPHGPIASVSYVKYYDSSGTQQTWDTDLYLVSTGNPGRVAPIQNQFFPVIASQIDAVNIRYVAGYGSSASSVPARAKSAIRLVVAHLYEHRVAVGDASTYLLEMGVDDLLRSIGVQPFLFM